MRNTCFGWKVLGIVSTRLFLIMDVMFFQIKLLWKYQLLGSTKWKSMAKYNSCYLIFCTFILSVFQYHHVQITLPGGTRYTCYLHRLVKMLDVNQYQMENLSDSEWLQLPKSLQWISLPDFDASWLECSHLCWNHKCLCSDHIVIESHKVRQITKMCKFIDQSYIFRQIQKESFAKD